ncbi:MAG: biotin transporter BioY [Solirubrobacterales bacterium]
MSTLSNAAAAPRVPVLADALANSRVRTALMVLGGALFTALMAQIVIPMTPVPMTGQTLAVLLVGSALGAKRGAASLALYVLMGFMLPVYADGGSGIATLWGASGGYLVGFILAAYFVGWMAEHGSDRKVPTAFISFVFGQLMIFIPGLIVLHAVTGLSWADTIHGGFTVFIIGGLVKAAFGAVLMPSAWKLQKHSFKS